MLRQASLSTLFLGVALSVGLTQPVGDTPAADKAIKDAAESLRKARDTAPNAKDRDKIGKALAALEHLLEAKAAQYTRESFKKAVIGKTQEEVIELLGKPARTSTLGTTTITFSYMIPVTDSITGNRDKSLDVDFLIKTKRAYKVQFYAQ